MPAEGVSESSIFGRDRRRAHRHRVHTPAYASPSGSAQGAITELCEILNISENGMCIQASSQMKINRLLPLCLELSETGARIHLVGHVVWSDPSGRTGIRFPEVSDAARTQLTEWLKANAQAEAPATVSFAPAPGKIASPQVRPIQPKPSSSPSYTSLVSEWGEIEKEVELYGPELDPALHLIAQRALTLTWASGTAIALINRLKPSEMICRARAGTDSPELGARLDSGSGFSGECIRAGKAITCDDTEYDSRVDRTSCRVLGIRSIVACPVKRDEEIIGIIEIFSPEPAAFWENDVTILQRLSGFVARAVHRAEYARKDVLAFPPPAGSAEEYGSNTDYRVEPPQFLTKQSSIGKKLFLLLTGIVCLTLVVWLVAPWITNLRKSSSSFSMPSAAEADSSHDSYATTNLKDLRQLANENDAAAQYALGMRYANANGVRQDYRTAREWFQKAAEQGHVRAQAKVAAAYWEGKGAPQDYSKAYFWALLAQAGGDETSPAIVMSCAAHMSPAQTSAEQKQAEQWLHSHNIGHDSNQ